MNPHPEPSHSPLRPHLSGLAAGALMAQALDDFAALRNEDLLTPDLVFRDPYILDFLGLKDRYLEKGGVA